MKVKDQQEKYFQPSFRIESRRDLRMFVAGVCSAAHIIFEKPAGIAQIKATAKGMKTHFGGGFCAAEDLVDSGIQLVPPHDDDAPMVYHVDNPVEIEPGFSRKVEKEAMEFGKKVYAQMHPQDPKLRLQTVALPEMLLQARAAIRQHERFPSARSAERLAEMYDNIRWNEEVWRNAGDEVFQAYQQSCREIEEHC